MSKYILKTAAVIGFLLMSATVWAQVTSIEGDVKGPDGQPMKGAVIKIVRTDIKGHYTVKTDKHGHYYYGGLGMGTYNVSVEVDGQVRDSVSGVRTQVGDPTEVPFNLKQTAEQQKALQKAAETGTLTAEQSRALTPEQKAQLEKEAKQRSAEMQKNKALNDSFNAGRQAMETGNWDLAVENLKKASEVDPSQPAVWSNLAESYGKAAQKKIGPDREAAYAGALAAYQKAIALKPDDPAFHNNYALILAADKKLSEAEAELTKAAQLDPANAAKYYYNLGAVLVNTGQNDAAGDAFKKAIAANPNYADAEYQYGVYLVSKATVDKSGKVVPPPGAVEAFQKYLELEPNGPNAAAAKGMLETLTGSVETKYSNPATEHKKKR
jgi:tetratricopeptide (TPR) repeat protein